MSRTTRPDLRSALRRGEALHGLFVKLTGRASIDLAHRAGFDFVVIDLEHSTLTERDALDAGAHAAAIGLAAIVRLPAVDAGIANRLLEVGVAGIQVSTLRTSADARALRNATRHSPHGTRSISLAHPMAGYGTTGLRAHLAAEAADPPLVIGQIETATTDDPLEDVVEPLDVAFLGTTDLSVDLGRPGELVHPDVTGRVDEVVRAARNRDVTLGGFANGPAQVPALRDHGARFLVVGSDIALLARAVLDVGEALTSNPNPQESP